MNSAPNPTPNRLTSLPAIFDQLPLDQLAFRYIANELTADELQGFEELLATDQGAREAVASAVELAQAIAFVETTSDSPILAPVTVVDRVAASGPVTSDRRTWWPALGWMAVGSAACAALIFLADQWSLDQVGSSGSDRQLAMLWSETRGTAHGFIAGDEDEIGETDAASASVRRSHVDSGRTIDHLTNDKASEDEVTEDAVAGDEGTGSASTTYDSTTDDSDSSESWGDPMSSPMFDTPSWMLAAVAETAAPSRSAETTDRVPQTGKEER